MAQYVIVYLGGNHPSTPEEGQQHFAKYMEWLSSLGDAAVSPANPLGNTHSVSSDGSVAAGGSSTMSGYTIVEAQSMDVVLVASRPRVAHSPVWKAYKPGHYPVLVSGVVPSLRARWD